MAKSTKIIIMVFFIAIAAFSGILIYTNSLGSASPKLDTENPDTFEPRETEYPNEDGLDKVGDNNPAPTEVIDKTSNDTVQEAQGITNRQSYAYKLVNKNTKNILVVGMDKSNGIYDSMGVISINESKKAIKIIMFPRDLYVDYSKKIKKQVAENDPDYWNKSNRGVYRINNLHNIGIKLKYDEGIFDLWSMNFISAYLNEVFDIRIDSYIRVNTTGFVDLVDLFGGVDLNVPCRMKYEDPVQDLFIDLKPGFQHLNGKQVEGFVRFRGGIDDDGKEINIGDLKRKENQYTFLKAFFEQHANISLAKANALYSTINKNIKSNITNNLYVKYVKLIKKAVDYRYSLENCAIKGEAFNINNDSYYRLATKDKSLIH